MAGLAGVDVSTVYLPLLRDRRRVAALVPTVADVAVAAMLDGIAQECSTAGYLSAVTPLDGHDGPLTPAMWPRAWAHHDRAFRPVNKLAVSYFSVVSRSASAARA